MNKETNKINTDIFFFYPITLRVHFNDILNSKSYILKSFKKKKIYESYFVCKNPNDPKP